MTETRTPYETADDGVVFWWHHGTTLVRHAKTLKPGEHSDAYLDLSAAVTAAAGDRVALTRALDRADALYTARELTAHEYAAVLTAIGTAADRL